MTGVSPADEGGASSGRDRTDGWTAVVPLADLLVRSTAGAPDAAAFVVPGRRYTYTTVLRRAVEVARGLLAVGVRERQHVGLLAQNGIELVEGLFGIALMGGVAVPINARHRASELAYIVGNADLAAVLTTGPTEDGKVDLAGQLTEAFPDLALQADPARVALAAAPRMRAAVLLDGGSRDGFLTRATFATWAQRVTPADVHAARMRVRVRDPALILYTSGTTANPKGCVLSHEAVTRGAVERATTRYGTGHDDVTWGGGPLYHVGCLSPFIGSIGAGGTYVTDTFFDPSRAISLMATERATVAFPWFPAIMQPILDDPSLEGAALESLRTIFIIGPAPLVERVQATFPGTELIAACGMTETAGIYALSDRSETTRERVEAHGRAAAGVELSIVDPVTGEALPDGTMGEMLIRGYCLLDRYHKDVDKTAAALDDDGWLHTGDLYERLPDGRVIFRDRLKDMLKVGGENVATIEIESLLCSHPAVRMASVVGRPDGRLGEVPVAFVETDCDAGITGEDLIAFCRERISRYKIPAEVRLVRLEDWPMSTTKIDKRALRQRLSGTPGGG